MVHRRGGSGQQISPRRRGSGPPGPGAMIPRAPDVGLGFGTLRFAGLPGDLAA